MRNTVGAVFLFFACHQGLGAQSVSSVPPFFELNVGQFVDGGFHLVTGQHQWVLHDDGFDVWPTGTLSSQPRTPAGKAVPEGLPVRFRFLNASRGLARGEKQLGFRSSYLLSPHPQE